MHTPATTREGTGGYRYEAPQLEPWAADLLARARAASPGPVPLYDSAGWRALDASDPRKFAAAVRAAEAWRIDGETLPERLRRELDATAAADERLNAAEWREAVRGLRAPSHREWLEELERRHAELVESRRDWLRLLGGTHRCCGTATNRVSEALLDRADTNPTR